MAYHWRQRPQNLEIKKPGPNSKRYYIVDNNIARDGNNIIHQNTPELSLPLKSEIKTFQALALFAKI